MNLAAAQQHPARRGMSKEIPLQPDMFTGEFADTRTSAQKRQDRTQDLPKPAEMFSQRDIAQFGVTAHPHLPISDHTRLGLAIEDHRTPKEIEQDTQHEAERNTYELFPNQPKALIVRPDYRPVAICIVDF